MCNTTPLVHFAWLLGLENFLPPNGFSTKPLKVKLLAGEQKATETEYLAHRGSLQEADLPGTLRCVMLGGPCQDLICRVPG